ncbi:MAG: surface-adhesin E family protein [Pararobbsia sp.]
MNRKFFAALCVSIPFYASAQPLEDWVPIAQSQSETLLMKPSAAQIYADGTRRASIKTAFHSPQTVGGIVFTTTVTRMVFDCAKNQAKIVQTDFFNRPAIRVYTDNVHDAAFEPIQAETEPALVAQVVCTKKKREK